VLGATIDLSLVGLLNYAFSMPRDGTLTALSAQFKVTAGLSLPLGTVNVRATVYTAPQGSNLFSATAATVTLQPPLSIIAIGTTVSGTVTGLNIPLTTGTQVLMVFSMVSQGLLTAATLTGAASAGINIIE
jgi:BclB C-terminal domain-containing protein